LSRPWRRNVTPTIALSTNNPALGAAATADSASELERRVTSFMA